jgi:hypothetical protein
VPFAERRPVHRAGVELAAVDSQHAAEAAADLERRFDDGVAGETRGNRFEIREAGGGGPSRSSSSSQGAGRKVPLF